MMEDNLANLINSMQFDLEEIRLKLTYIEHKYNEIYFGKHEMEFGKNHSILDGAVGISEMYSKLAITIRQMTPSYMGPAYNFNDYIKNLHTDLFWDDIKYALPEDEYISMGLREAKVIVTLQNTLISVKSALDRMVGVFGRYYNGITGHTTFGRLEPKPKGFMGIVNANHAKDPLLRYVMNQYKDWIRDAVKPRDAIIHYNDLLCVYEWDGKEKLEIPIHVFNRDGEERRYSFLSIHSYCMKWYSFFDTVMDELTKREPFLPKPIC